MLCFYFPYSGGHTQCCLAVSLKLHMACCLAKNTPNVSITLQSNFELQVLRVQMQSIIAVPQVFSLDSLKKNIVRRTINKQCWY